MTLLNIIRNSKLQNSPSAPRNQFSKHYVDNSPIKQEKSALDRQLKLRYFYC